MQPRKWCDPSSAFGNPHADARAWRPPADPADLEEFRAAVIQHAIAISVRRAKNALKMTQRQLAAVDGRGQDALKWNRRLNGQQGLQMVDLSVILRAVPGALPSEADMQLLLDVAEKRIPPPSGWAEVDS